ncbi:unnamed protein product [Mycena citricolor]|uniref:glutathione transferase n=1 Tax=Mycena citricolor TaxID=2018698 RepID=A0AAD2GVI4_9AGAR|nr:unnamed protein product [Mycena citricolor]CAK5275393.1 unnamed protein product [Mycena citricolor]
MVLKLYGYTHSSCTRSVATVCKEIGVPFEFILIDIAAGEQKTPEHLARQPFGVVPAIEDDGFSLFESRPIARYIVAKYGNGSTLVPDPKDIQATAKFEQAMSIESNHFDSVALPIIIEKVFNPMRGLATDETKLAALVATINAKMDVYEKMLAKQTYLAGNTLTIADIFHCPWLEGLKTAVGPELFTSRPNVNRWVEDITSRPSWQSVKNGV